MNTMRPTESLFVEEVTALAGCPFGHAAPAPRPGYEEAERLLAEARASVYYWPEAFGGFCASVTLLEGEHAWRGDLVMHTSRRYALDLDAPAARWARSQIEEIVAHRESPAVSRMVLKAGAALGDWDGVHGRKVVLVNDPMKSFYRIKDRRITQIGRHYKGQALRIDIDRHQEHCGRFASLAYTAFYRGLEDGALRQVEAYLDEYREVCGLLLPASRRYTCADGGGYVTRLLRFDDVTLL